MDSSTLRPAVRASLMSLQEIAISMAATQKRLATGRKVNSPFDNPAAYFTASALETRAGALNTLLDQVGVGQKALEAARNAMQGIEKLVASAQEVARQAQASADTLAKVTGSVAGLGTGTALSMTNGRTITVSDGTTTVTFTKANGATVQDFITAVNASGPLAVTASLTSEGRLQLKADGTENITLGGTATTGELATLGLAAGTTTFTTNTTRETLARQFDSLRSQIDAMASDASFNGANLLQGSTLSMKFNESGTSILSVDGISLSAAGLGVTEVASGSGGSFQTDAEITQSLSQLEAALGTLRGEAVRLGSVQSMIETRQSFTKSMIDTLQSGAADLVLADTDAEGAVLLALQTRQQIASAALSLSSQAGAQALRMFS